MTWSLGRAERYPPGPPFPRGLKVCGSGKMEKPQPIFWTKGPVCQVTGCGSPIFLDAQPFNLQAGHHVTKPGVTIRAPEAGPLSPNHPLLS